MSGGGNHVSRGGMSSKLQAEAVSPQVLKTYEQESESKRHAVLRRHSRSFAILKQKPKGSLRQARK
ncbi:hypothetical protein P692DRAFT_20498593 [Suillus brevipes Sb2]|nr:hypothetical protein P692DRAFT_20498593 [Suillus brevipes Sb2]